MSTATPPPDATTRLPPEVLAKIFKELQAGAASRQLEWVRVTWVCGRWREVALQAPRMWTSLFVDHKCDSTLLSDLVSRSKILDLDLDVDGRLAGLGLTTSVVVAHTNRLTTLTIAVTYPQLTDLEAALVAGFPRLTKLAVEASDIVNTPWTTEDLEDKMLTLAPLTLPALRALSMRAVVVKAPQDILEALTTLNVRDTFKYNPIEHLPPFQDYLLDLLNACSNVEDLTLNNVTCADPERWSQRLVKLQNLKKLTFDGRLTVRFLYFFRVPATVALRIHSQWENWVDIEPGVIYYAAPLQIMDTAFPSTKQSERLTLRTTENVIKAAGCGPDPDATRWEIVTNLRGTVRLVNVPMLHKAMLELRDLVDARRIVHLELHLRIPRDKWRYFPLEGVVNRFVNVRTLVLGGAAAVRGLLEGWQLTGVEWWIGSALVSVTFCLPGPVMFLGNALKRYQWAFASSASRSLAVTLPMKFRKLYSDGWGKQEPAIFSGCDVYDIPVRWEWVLHVCTSCQRVDDWKQEEAERENLPVATPGIQPLVLLPQP